MLSSPPFTAVTLQLFTAPPSSACPCEHTGDAHRHDGRSEMFALLERLGPPSTATSSDIRPPSFLGLSLPPVGDGGPLEAVCGMCPCASGTVVLCTHLLNKCPTQSLFKNTSKESWGFLLSDCRANRPHPGLCPEANVPLQGRLGSRGFCFLGRFRHRAVNDSGRMSAEGRGY